MKNIIAILLLLGLTANGSAQSMKASLFNMVSRCYQTWKSEGEGTKIVKNREENEYGSIEYDIPNGYVQTSGGWPTCGCGCEAKAAAFKDAKGKYTYVKYEEWNCNDYGVSAASRKLEDILPEGFGIETFVGFPVESPGKYSFQAKFVIPMWGTEMDVNLSVLPFGSVPNNINGLTFETTSEINSTPALNCVRSISYDKKIDNNTYLLLAERKYDKIPADQKEIIDKELSEYEVSKHDLCMCMMDLKEMYDIYELMECHSVRLKWNRETARFEIKSKGGKAPSCTFEDFIKKVAEFAEMRC
jgi:hypothetical protein